MKIFFAAAILFGALVATGQDRFTMTALLEPNSLNQPWEILYGPDDWLWITERAGKRVVRIHPETGEKDELIKIFEVYQLSTQDGLLGMALHPGLGKSQSSDYVYLSHTYFDGGRKQKIVRYTYQRESDDGSLNEPVAILTGLPASNDHNSGRLLFGPDSTLYYTIGDQGKNQYDNTCARNMAQDLPTQEQVNNQDWSSYEGKVLRINLDGTIPEDNPVINGVRSHIYSYGHRNPQGLVFTGDGKLFAAEHGPKSDDEINRILPGKNYGWPYIAGYIDDQAYAYCEWHTSADCSPGRFDDYRCPDDAVVTAESSWNHPDFTPPVQTFYTVEDDYDFTDPTCNALFICWPTIAPSSLEVYESDGIQHWGRSLLVVSLKEGSVYRLPVDSNGEVSGTIDNYWDTQNRYRDMAVHPDGQTFYIITDNSGQTSGPSTGNTSELSNPGTILRFRYSDEPSLMSKRAFPEISIFPNPANESFTLRYHGLLKDLPKKVCVLSLEGKRQRLFSGTADTMTILTSELSEGLYLVQTFVEGVVLTERVWVRH